MQHVFLTGATGYLGAFLLESLLRNSNAVPSLRNTHMHMHMGSASMFAV